MTLRSPTRIARGIRSSYRLKHRNPDSIASVADVTELQVPVRVVVDGETGVLKAVWSA